jgi:dTDP-4-amino-4,6-dideoxygalactose transaminase
MKGYGEKVIHVASPVAQYISYQDEIDTAISGVLKRGWYVLGEETRAFESEFSAYIGRGYGIGVGSGTEALHIALLTCGIGEGDEVITVSHTAVATVAAIELCGARPVLVDIENEYLTMDPEKLSDAITPRTKAFIPVHIYGQTADMAALSEVARTSGIIMIEDCAQACGATDRGRQAGSFGDMSCFSFYPTKNLGAIGDGGMIVTDNPDLAEKARRVREYGWAERYVSSIPGLNSRLDELQAAVLRVKLRHLDEANDSRLHLASVYENGLRGTEVRTPMVRPETRHVYHLYVIRARARDELRAFLKSRGVGSMIHYPVPVHQQPAYIGRVRCPGDMTVTEQAVREILSLPMYPELDVSAVHTVAEAVRTFYGGKA